MIVNIDHAHKLVFIYGREEALRGVDLAPKGYRTVLLSYGRAPLDRSLMDMIRQHL